MRKLLYNIFILVGLFFSSLSHAQIVLEALEKPTGCSAIPSFHPFHKVTKGNYKYDGTFADPYTGEGSAYMYWEDTKTHNFPAGYHLPTVYEWMTITPNNNIWSMANNSTQLNVLEYHQFGKKGQASTQYKTFKGDYYKASDGTLYGIRFKTSDARYGLFTAHQDNSYTTAYRYRVVSGDRLLVDIKYIGLAQTTLQDVISPAYWGDDACIDSFVFLYKGFFDYPTTFHNVGGWWWLDTVYFEFGSEYPLLELDYGYFGRVGAIWWQVGAPLPEGFGTNGESYMDTIRLFKD